MSSDSTADYVGKEVKRSFSILWFILGGWIYISPWIMDTFYRYIVVPLVGLDKAIRWRRWNVILQCVLMQVVFCGSMLAAPFDGDPALFFWGAMLGVWAGVRSGRRVADSLAVTRMQMQMEKPDIPGHFSQPSVVFKNEAQKTAANGKLTLDDLATFRTMTAEPKPPRLQPRKPDANAAPRDTHRAEA